MDGMNIVGDLFGAEDVFASSCKISESNETICCLFTLLWKIIKLAKKIQR